MQETRFDSWVGKIHWRTDSLPTPIFLGFSCGSAGKESACNVGDLGLVPGLGRSPGEGKGYPLQYSGLENSMDCIVHGIAKSRTRLSHLHFTFRKNIVLIQASQSPCLYTLKSPLEIKSQRWEWQMALQYLISFPLKLYYVKFEHIESIEK